MACLPCQQQRHAFVRAARSLDARGVVQAVRTATAINLDKLRGMTPDEVAAKYGSPARPATPYRRPNRTV